MMDNGCYRMCVYSVLGIFLIRYSSAIARYDMETICGNGTYSSFDQVRVTLQLQLNQASCKMTLQTQYDYLMFYVERINLPCRTGYLTLGDGNIKLDELETICGDAPMVGRVYTTEASHLTILYTSQNPQDDGEAFSLITTSFSTGYCPRTRHKCDNGRCITKELHCNGFNSCGEYSRCRQDSSSNDVVISTGGEKKNTGIDKLFQKDALWSLLLVAGCVAVGWYLFKHHQKLAARNLAMRNRTSSEPDSDGNTEPPQLQQSSTVIAIPAVTGNTSSTEDLAETGDTIDTKTLAVTGDTSSTETLADTGDTVDTETIDTDELAETGDTIDNE